MTNTSLLKQRIEESGLRRGFLAEKLGISIESFRRKVNGETQFLSEEIVALTRLLHIENVEEYFFDLRG